MVHPDSQENDYTCQDISLGKQEANNMQVRTGYKDERGKKPTVWACRNFCI